MKCFAETPNKKNKITMVGDPFQLNLVPWTIIFDSVQYDHLYLFSFSRSQSLWREDLQRTLRMVL